MAADQYDFVFGQVLGHEGGFQNDARDRGNWTTGVIGKGQNKGTKFGITAMSYPDLDIRNLTIAQAKDVYRRDYWDRLKLDRVPAGVDLALFDFAVNSGRDRAAKTVQVSVDVDADGLIGNETIAAINAADPNDLAAEICDRRMSFLRSLPTFKTYGKGWTTRVAGVRKVALQMVKNEAIASAKPAPVQISTTQEAEEAYLKDKQFQADRARAQALAGQGPQPPAPPNSTAATTRTTAAVWNDQRQIWTAMLDGVLYDLVIQP